MEREGGEETDRREDKSGGRRDRKNGKEIMERWGTV